MAKEKEQDCRVAINSISPDWKPKKGDVVIMQIKGKYYLGVMIDEKYTSAPHGPYFTQLDVFEVAKCLVKNKSIYVCNCDKADSLNTLKK